jgi:phosphoglycerol transferase MdoB-like AlkP superfamily enzyme
MVTLTSHGPFNLPQQYRQLKLDESMDNTKLGGYFQSVNYTDRQIGTFLSRLDKDGVLDNSVVVIFGDHCGIHKYYQDELFSIQPQEDWWLIKNRCVPFIIYQKQMAGEKLTVTGGQIDIMPTVAYMMGIDEKEFQNTAMGRILVKTKKDFAVLNDYTYIGIEASKNDKKIALKGIDIADKIISSNYFKALYSNKKANK